MRKNNDVVRILEFTSCNTLREYLQPKNGGKITTGRDFPVEMLFELLQNRKKGQILTGSLSENQQSLDDIYQFYFSGDCNLKPSSLSNLETSNLAVVMPGAVKEQNKENEQLYGILSGLTKITEQINQEARLRNFKLQKRNDIIKKTTRVTLKALAITGTAVGLAYGIHAASDYIGEQQQNQRQQQYQNLQQYYLEHPTVSELQEQRIQSEQDPEMQQFLNSILEQHAEEEKQR